jgi:endonuclease/exonuclease/phosphatase family metal-dependent hydrolase
MTYNVHGCMGRDGKVSVTRIARLIARHNPGIVCLQELDAVRPVHQAEAISRKLAMEFHYFSSMKSEKRGNAILSRYPLRLVKMGPLPRSVDSPIFEPRGAIWVEIDVNGKKIQLFNTHLSLSPQEALKQAVALMGPDWAGGVKDRDRLVVCGDFNADPPSKVCGKIGEDLKSVQAGRKVINTLTSYAPLRAVDHIFTGKGLRTLKVEVPRTGLERIASDHLPLVAELELV